MAKPAGRQLPCQCLLVNERPPLPLATQWPQVRELLGRIEAGGILPPLVVLQVGAGTHLGAAVVLQGLAPMLSAKRGRRNRDCLMWILSSL